MLHLILLVLCWNFVAIPAGTFTAGTPKSDYFISLAGTAFFGTLIWLVLEGVYYLAITYVF